jgi:hypothetical protein
MISSSYSLPIEAREELLKGTLVISILFISLLLY